MTAPVADAWPGSEFDLIMRGYADAFNTPDFADSNFVQPTGPIPCRVMIIGEAPGREENDKQVPFVGPAGMFLTQCMETIGLPRERVYITNVLKHRPPGNRRPRHAEIVRATRLLRREVRLVDPALVILLGNTPLQTVFGREHGTISTIHGTPIDQWGRTWLPLYHPSNAVRDPKHWRGPLMSEFRDEVGALLLSLRQNDRARQLREWADGG